MRTLTALLVTCLVGCTSHQTQHTLATDSPPVTAESQTTPSDYPLSHVKEARDLPSKIALCTEDEPGEKMVIFGTVYEEDCATPVPGAVLYLYQTDARGVYSDEKENDKRPKLRGYLKTDAEGRYEIRSIKPGHYPHIKSAAHIHVHVEPPGRPEYGDSLWFAHDPVVSGIQDKKVAMMEQQPKDFGLVELTSDQAGVWRGIHHFGAPPGTAKYQAALLAATTPLEKQLLEVDNYRGTNVSDETVDALAVALKSEAAEPPNPALEQELRRVVEHLGWWWMFRTNRFMYTDDAGVVLTERRFPDGSGPPHPHVKSTTETTEVQVHDHGDTAVLSSLDVERVRIKGLEFSKSSRFTNILVKREGKWQLLAAHVSPVGFRRVEARIDPKILDSNAGMYEDPLWGRFRVAREGNAIVFTSANGYRTEYLPESETEFFLRDEQARKVMLQTVTFVRAATGQVSHCVLRQNDGQNIVAKRLNE